MKVLLVEDDQDVAELLSATLTQHRCAVDWVADGRTLTVSACVDNCGSRVALRPFSC